MPGILVLNSGLVSVGSKYPLYCVVTSEVNEENKRVLELLGIHVIERPEIPMPETMRDYNEKHGMMFKGWFKAFSKFHVFGLEEFDKIVYLDSDLLILKNLDHLFEKPHMSATVDLDGIMDEEPDFLAEGDRYFRFFNSGLMVIEPKMSLFEDIMDLVNKIVPDRIYADQNLLAAYFKDWPDHPELKLSTYYNLLAPHIDTYKTKVPGFDMKQAYVLHFVGTKPFMMDKSRLVKHRDAFTNLCVAYNGIYMGQIRKMRRIGIIYDEKNLL